jgi:hypothetical protein
MDVVACPRPPAHWWPWVLHNVHPDVLWICVNAGAGAGAAAGAEFVVAVAPPVPVFAGGVFGVVPVPLLADGAVGVCTAGSITGAFVGLPPHPAITANNEHTNASCDLKYSPPVVVLKLRAYLSINSRSRTQSPFMHFSQCCD